MDAKEYRESQGISLPEWNSVIEQMMENYHKSKLEELLPSDEEVLKDFPLMTEDEEAMRMNSLIRIGIKWLRDKIKQSC